MGSAASVALESTSGVPGSNSLATNHSSGTNITITSAATGSNSAGAAAATTGNRYSAMGATPAITPTTTINPAKIYQTIEGFGGATAFYEGWIPAHPYQLEIYSNAFAGLNLSMLRLGNWYRYQTPLSGFDAAATVIVSNANRVLGYPVPVYMSSWSPPASLKSNGQTGNGGTLATNSNGSFNYSGFAQYWYDAINAYQSNGVTLTWASIQNEPDFVAAYDSCILNPSEGVVNGTNYASYARALTATYQLLTNLPAPPKLLAPECVHISYNDLVNYAAQMNANNFYGVTTHLYGDGGSTADSFLSAISSATNIFPAKPHFMTEYGFPDMINTACLIHNCLTVEQDAGFNYWSLVWPYPGDALVQIENPYDAPSTWTNAPPGVTTDSHGWWLTPAYWAMKHFSYFIQPGFIRVGASETDANVRSSAYLAPNGLRLVVVLINTNATAASTMGFNFGTFTAGVSSVYQTAGTNTYAGTNTFLPLGTLANVLILPPQSLTTIVLDKIVALQPANNPSPTNGATGVSLNARLGWTPGTNALMHAVYFGTSSNAVAAATPASPEFQGIIATNSIPLPATGWGATDYWRVDEITYANTNQGPVWSFSTAPPVQLLSPWQSQDIGGAVSQTSAIYSNGVFFVTGSGADIQGASDAFRYAYLTLAGNSTIIARVSGEQNVNSWSKAGVMIRASLNSNAANAFIGVTPGNGVTWQYRSTAGVGTSYNNTSGLTAPYWVKLVWSGSTFTGYYSPNGMTWTQQGTVSFTMAAPAYLGLAVTSHAAPAVCTATFDNVTAPGWPLLPAAPASLTATAGNSEVTLGWPVVSGASGYQLEIASNRGGPYGVLTNVITTACTNTGLANGTTYYYVVSAFNIAGASSNSVPVSATPEAPPALNLSPAGTNFIFSWPLVSGFSLQSSTNLASGNWLTVTSAVPQSSGGQWLLTLPVNAGAPPTYYRLLK